MAWNPSPEVAALRDYAAKFDRPVVVAFSIERGGDRFHITTYGETKQLCRLAAAFGDRICDAVASGRIAAPDVDPGPLPVASTWRREPVVPVEVPLGAEEVVRNARQ